MTPLACAVALAAGSGCGQSDQEQVREATEDYIQTVSKGDFAATCELFTEDYRAQLGGDAACVQAQRAQFGPGETKVELEIASVRVNGDRGNAGLDIRRDGGTASPLSLLFVFEDDRWRIRGQQ